MLICESEGQYLCGWKQFRFSCTKRESYLHRYFNTKLTVDIFVRYLFIQSFNIWVSVLRTIDNSLNDSAFEKPSKKPIYLIIFELHCNTDSLLVKFDLLTSKTPLSIFFGRTSLLCLAQQVVNTFKMVTRTLLSVIFVRMWYICTHFSVSIKMIFREIQLEWQKQNIFATQFYFNLTWVLLNQRGTVDIVTSFIPTNNYALGINSVFLLLYSNKECF